MKIEGDDIELVVGQARLLAIVVPGRLEDARRHAVEALSANLKLDVGLSHRWQVWAVYRAEDWEVPAERPKATLKLVFANVEMSE